MRLVCPSCDSAYDVPDHRLGVLPRRLRCARCAHEWTVEPVVDPPQPAAPPEWPPPPVLPAMPPLVAEVRRARETPVPAYRMPPGPDWRALAAWAASLLLLAGLVVAAVRFRAEIMQAWPPSARLYGLFAAGPR